MFRSACLVISAAAACVFVGALFAQTIPLIAPPDKTIVIPGHGPIGNKAQLIEFRDMLGSIHEKVATLKKQGQSLDEVVAAVSRARANFGTLVRSPVPNFVRTFV